MKARMKMSLNSRLWPQANASRRPSAPGIRRVPLRGAHETAASGDHGHFSGELARPVSSIRCSLRDPAARSPFLRTGVSRKERSHHQVRRVCRLRRPPATGYRNDTIDLGNGKDRKGLCAGSSALGIAVKTSFSPNPQDSCRRQKNNPNPSASGFPGSFPVLYDGCEVWAVADIMTVPTAASEAAIRIYLSVNATPFCGSVIFVFLQCMDACLILKNSEESGPAASIQTQCNLFPWFSDWL